MKKAILLLSVFSAVFLANACGGKSNTANSNSAESKTEIVEVTTEKAVQRDLPSYFEATGSLAADGQSDVAPIVGGRVVEVNFDVGSYVNRGDVLVRLDDRDYRLRLEQAERQVEQGNAQVEQAKTGVNQAEQGVEQAKANVEQAKASLRQTQIRLGLSEGSNFDINKFSQVISTKAQLDLAEKELKRAEKLLASGDISKSLYDQRLANRNQLLGQMEESRSNAAVAVKAIQTAEAAVRTAQQGVNTAITQVNSAKANLNNVLRSVETAKVQIDQARKAINDAVVYAPMSGYVSERLADVGEFLNPSAPNTRICTILRTSTLRMKIDIPEQNIGEVKQGQLVSLAVSAYPDRNFAGNVTAIYPNLNAQSRTLTVEAEIDNGNGLLKPNQFATVRIVQSKAETAVLIPKTALRNDGGVNKVFVIDNGRAMEKLVQLGVEEADLIQVKSGISTGEQVAVTNVQQLFDGVTVKQ